MDKKLFKPLREQIEVVHIKRQPLTEEDRVSVIESLLNDNALNKLTDLVESAIYDYSSLEEDEFFVKDFTDEELSICLEAEGYRGDEEAVRIFKENYKTIYLHDNVSLSEDVNYTSALDAQLQCIIEMSDDEFAVYGSLLTEENILALLERTSAEKEAERINDKAGKEYENTMSTLDKTYDSEMKQHERDFLNNRNDIYNTEEKETNRAHQSKARLEKLGQYRKERQDIKDKISNAKTDLDRTNAELEYQKHKDDYGHVGLIGRIGAKLGVSTKKAKREDYQNAVTALKKDAADKRDAAHLKNEELRREKEENTHSKRMQGQSDAIDQLGRSSVSVDKATGRLVKADAVDAWKNYYAKKLDRERQKAQKEYQQKEKKEQKEFQKTYKKLTKEEIKQEKKQEKKWEKNKKWNEKHPFRPQKPTGPASNGNGQAAATAGA